MRGGGVPCPLPSDRAISPVVGTALLIVIVVVLVGMSGAFFLSLADQRQPAPQTDFSFAVDPATDTLSVTVDGGDSVSASNTGRLVVVVDGEHGSRRVTWASTDGGVVDLDPARLTAGSALAVDDASGTDTGDRTVGFEYAAGDEVTVVWYSPSGDHSTVLARGTVSGLGGPTPLFDDDATVVTGGSAVRGDGSGTVSLGLSGAAVLGNTYDVDSDGVAELPYVDSTGDLRLNDTRGTDQLLVDASSSAAPRADKSRLAAGAWNGSQPSVFYADSSSSKIYRVTPGGSPAVVVDNPDGDGVSGVLGPGDVDGDGTAEMVYTGTSQTVYYVEPSTPDTQRTFSDGGAGYNNGIGIGPPRDFDGDGTASVVVVDGSNRIKLLNASGSRYPAESTLDNNDSTEAAKSPPTAADVDDDGSLEIVYLNQNGYVRYIDDVGGANTVRFLRAGDGDKVSGNDELGLVS